MASTSDVIVRDPEILGGTPVFRGTRVPLQALFDSLEGGETLEESLEGFPTVTARWPSPPWKKLNNFCPANHECGFCSTSV